MAKQSPLPLRNVSRTQFSSVKVVFFDIDDTFSGGLKQARILPEAYNALWRLSRAGLHVVPVTGRPAGWCDFITRMWPVTAVVGENGAFYSYMDRSSKNSRLVKKYLEPKATRAKNALRLQRLQQSIQRAFPGARVASDQHFREFDLAIDYCEDVARWPDAKVQRLLEFCREKGAVAKLSSIHVNTWFGRYDKWSCVRRILSQFFKLNPDEEIENIVYIGDSPNDEPFFQRLPLSVGVANVRNFLHKMEHAPAYVSESCGGLGFAEFAERLLECRR